MADRESLLFAALDRPDDDTARLVLADFLREQPDEADVALGRFVWAGVTASRYRSATAVADGDLDAALGELSSVCTEGWPARWFAALGLGPSPLTRNDWGCESIDDRVTVQIGPTTGEFERGMLAGLTATLAGWYDAAERALAAWPVERVTVSDVPGRAFWVSPPGGDRPGWCLSVALTVQPVRPGSCPACSARQTPTTCIRRVRAGGRSRRASRTGRCWSRAWPRDRSGWSSG
jgi:uncharacterized protein (TIGR02996 family)